MKKSSLVFCAAIVFCSVNLRGFATDIEEVNTLLYKCFEGRNKIKSGHFILERSSTYGNFGPKQYTVDLFFQNEKVRVEKKTEKKTNFIIKDGVRENSVLVFDPAPYYPMDPPDRKAEPFVALYEGEHDNNLAGNKESIIHIASSDYYFPDCRFLGMIPIPLQSLTLPLPSIVYFASPSVKKTVRFAPEIQEVSFEGDDCLLVSWKTSYTLETGDAPMMEHSVWIVPQKDYLVRQYVTTVVEKDHWHRSSVRNHNIRQEEKTGIWYPSRFVFEEANNSKILETEECSLKIISLNEPIDDDVFSLENLSLLEPGTRVYWYLKSEPPDDGPLCWDGGGIRNCGEVFFNEAVKGDSSKRWQLIIAINAFLLSMIAASIFFRYWMKLKEAK